MEIEDEINAASAEFIDALVEYAMDMGKRDDEDGQIEVQVEAKLYAARDLSVEVLKKKIKAALLTMAEVDEVEELNVFTM